VRLLGADPDVDLNPEVIETIIQRLQYDDFYIKDDIIFTKYEPVERTRHLVACLLISEGKSTK
jgi:hypothetical protein